jgi:hypothetical protein
MRYDAVLFAFSVTVLASVVRSALYFLRFRHGLQGIAYLKKRLPHSKYKTKLIRLIARYQRYTKKPKGWHGHHIRPRSEGGSDDRENIVYVPQSVHRTIHQELARAYRDAGNDRLSRTNTDAANFLHRTTPYHRR